MNWRVPLLELRLSDGDVDAYLDRLQRGWLTMGPVTREFELAFAERVGAKHAVAVSSGTAALQLASLAAGLGEGDEALVPSFGFVACAHAPRYAGAEPVFCEIGGPEDLNIAVADLEERIGERTKALICPHMCGYPADLSALRDLCHRRDLVLIEDCAQAIGALDPGGHRVGTRGGLGCFSFVSKAQLPVGEGGMVVTDDPELAERVISLRSHAMTSATWERHIGQADAYDVTDLGFNYRLDEPRAALGLSRLRRLGEEIEGRRGVARAYRERLADLKGVGLVWGDDDVERASHFALPVMLADRAVRDAVRAHLLADGVQTTVYPALHRLAAYRRPEGSLPRAESAADRHLMLPMFAGLEEERIELVVSELQCALGATEGLGGRV